MDFDFSSIQLDLANVRKDVFRAQELCDVFCLKKSSFFLNDLLHGIHDPSSSIVPSCDTNFIDSSFLVPYKLIKSLIYDGQYKYASSLLTKHTTKSIELQMFLILYSDYLYNELIYKDNVIDSAEYVENLNKMSSQFPDNGDKCVFLQYYKSIVLGKLNKKSAVLSILIKIIREEPHIWCFWESLVNVLSHSSDLANINLPDNSVCYYLFYVKLFTKFCLIDDALSIINSLQNAGFKKWSHLSLCEAELLYLKKKPTEAIKLFSQVYEEEPYRFEKIDIFSHALYIVNDETQLNFWAQFCASHAPFAYETCIVIGNKYAADVSYNKALQHFQMAAVLQPDNASVHILMGHCYIELQNKAMAIKSYSHALLLNPKDHRASYGLGQLYEILNMTELALQYFKDAAENREWDGQVWEALGDCYHKLKMLEDAKHCYSRAHRASDITCKTSPTWKLAVLCEHLGETTQAFEAYSAYLNLCWHLNVKNQDDYTKANIFIAIACANNGDFDSAMHFATCAGSFGYSSNVSAMWDKINICLEAHGQSVAEPVLNQKTKINSFNNVYNVFYSSDED